MDVDDVMEFFEGEMLHIWDRIGDRCSGDDEAAMRDAAKSLVSWHHQLLAAKDARIAQLEEELAALHNEN